MTHRLNRRSVLAAGIAATALGTVAVEAGTSELANLIEAHKAARIALESVFDRESKQSGNASRLVFATKR